MQAGANHRFDQNEKQQAHQYFPNRSAFPLAGSGAFRSSASDRTQSPTVSTPVVDLDHSKPRTRRPEPSSLPPASLQRRTNSNSSNKGGGSRAQSRAPAQQLLQLQRSQRPTRQLWPSFRVAPPSGPRPQGELLRQSHRAASLKASPATRRPLLCRPRDRSTSSLSSPALPSLSPPSSAAATTPLEQLAVSGSPHELSVSGSPIVVTHGEEIPLRCSPPPRPLHNLQLQQQQATEQEQAEAPLAPHRRPSPFQSTPNAREGRPLTAALLESGFAAVPGGDRRLAGSAMGSSSSSEAGGSVATRRGETNRGDKAASTPSHRQRHGKQRQQHLPSDRFMGAASASVAPRCGGGAVGGPQPADPVPRPPSTARAEMDARDRDWVFRPPPNPQRTFFFAEDNIEFSSKFDSGNLIQVERVGAFRYNLYTAMDCTGDERQTNNRQWFHFAVRGGARGATVTVTVVGLLHSNMYTFDWMPVMAVLPSRPAYVRLPGKAATVTLDAVPPTPGYPELVCRDPAERRRLLEGADPATAAEEGAGTGGGGGDGDGDGEDEDATGANGTGGAGDDDNEAATVSPADQGPSGKGKTKAKAKKKPAAMNLTFDFRIDFDLPLSSEQPLGHPDCPAMYIASNHPYAYSTLQRNLDTWQRAAASRAGVNAAGMPAPLSTPATVWNYPPNSANGHQQDVYFHREVLCTSLEGRNVDLITISDMTGIEGSERGPYLMPMLTFNGEATPVSLPVSSARRETERPRRFAGKQYVVLSARVHAGECPGSHMMHGCFEFLMNSKDPRAVALRRHFVFFLVPMLNPDGVVRGHSRVDANGVDLNRMYRTPSYRRHPVAYGLWALLSSLAAERRLALYVDMHAHANKRGTFFYGNGMDAGAQVENLVYPKLVSLNTPYFEFKGCNYSESNMSAVTRSGLSKDCSCRVVLYTETGVVHSVAIEASYVAGKVLNPIVPLAGIPGEEVEVVASTRYSPATFGDTGKAMLLGLLDLKGLNPVSRVPLSPYQSVKGIALWIQRQLQTELAEKLFAQAYKDYGRIEPADAAQSPVTAILAKLTPEEIPEKVTVRGCRHLPPTTVSQVAKFLPLELADTLLAQTPPSGPPRSFVCAIARRRAAAPAAATSSPVTANPMMATAPPGLGEVSEAPRPPPVIAQPVGAPASKRSAS